RVDLRCLSVCRRDQITHVGSSGDQIEIEFALQTLLHNLHVQQSEKTATKAEAQSRRRFRLVKERSIIESQLIERVAQVFVTIGIDRKEAGEYHRLDFLIAGERFRRGSRRFCDRVTNLNVGDSLNRCGEKTDFAGGKSIGWRWPRTIHAQRIDLVIAAGGHETNL